MKRDSASFVSLKIWLSGLALLGLVFAVPRTSAQESALAQAARVVQPQAYVSIQPVPRNHAFEIAVIGKISPGFHINAHEPSEEYLIPTKITADLPPGVLLVESSYPHGVMRTFRFSKTPLRVYENTFTVRMKLRTQGSAPLGAQKIPLTVAYQACNQDSCLPPTKVPVTVALDIASPDAAVHPANPEVFASTSKTTHP